MTNEEIKKKIVDVAISQVWTDSFGDEIVIDREAAGAFADALIAAGLKFDVNYSFTAVFNNAQAERERDLERRLTAAEHRAKVAEMALKKACFTLARNYYTDGGDWARFRDEFVAHYKEQAEKELAE